jgi:uncharacterized protein
MGNVKMTWNGSIVCDQSDTLTPGEVVEFTIDLWATRYVFKAGYRIRLDIASANFPRYDRNLNVWQHPLSASEG